MTGTIINAALIIAGSLMGLFFGNKMKDKYKETIMKGIGLCVILIGFKMAFETKDMLLLIISIVIGSFLGEWIKIEDGLYKFSDKIRDKLHHKKGFSNFTEGFVTATLIYCVGSMAIVGAIENGVNGNPDILIAKGILDGVSAIVFTSTMGIGVLFSFVPVFIYQGSLSLLAFQMQPILTEVMVNEMSAVGGILILAIGLNILGIVKIRVGNMIPSIFIPTIYFILIEIFK